MCGIFGWIAASGRRPDAALVRAATRTMHSRGPDSEGYHEDDRVAFGMRRLSVIDIAGGEQPKYDAARAIAVVQNGEIYNFRELRSQLESAGYAFTSRSDTEVLVHGYDAWGIDGLTSRLTGMYAFAIHDRRERKVFVVRDRIGEKPLYWTRLGDGLLFASQLSTIAAHPDVERRLDPAAIEAYFAMHYVPGDLTILAGVRKLLPGHWLEYDLSQDTCKVHEYWRLEERDAPPRREGELREELRARVDAAVRQRMVADVPVGAFVSGGIDSTIVACAMARHTSKLRTFSMGFPDAALDESRAARVVAEHLGAEHHAFELDADRFLDLLPEVVASMDEPLGDQAVLPLYWLAREARAHVTVALSGEGADEVFAGYEYYRPSVRADDWQKPVLALVERWLAPRGSGDERLFDGERTTSGFPLLTSEGERGHLLRQPAALERLHWTRETYARRLSSIVEPLRRAQLTDTMTWLPDDLLMKLDKMTMAHSLEARAPFLDPELVRFGFDLPATLKMPLGSTRSKHLLREAYRDVVPAEILHRPKQGFVLPLRAWLQGRAGNLLRDALRVQHDEEWVNNDRLRASVERDLAAGATRERWLMAVLVYKQWLEHLMTLPVLSPGAVGLRE